MVPAAVDDIFHSQRSDAAPHHAAASKLWHATCVTKRCGTHLPAACTHAHALPAAEHFSAVVAHWHTPVAHTPPIHWHSTGGHASRSRISEHTIALHCPVEDTSHRCRSQSAPDSCPHGFGPHVFCSLHHMHRDDWLHTDASIPRHGISSHVSDPDTLNAQRSELRRHSVALRP